MTIGMRLTSINRPYFAGLPSAQRDYQKLLSDSLMAVIVRGEPSPGA